MSALAFDPRPTCCCCRLRRCCPPACRWLLLLLLLLDCRGALVPSRLAQGASLAPHRARSGRSPSLPGNAGPAPQTGLELDAYDELPEDELEDDYAEINVTAEKSKYLGSPCDTVCNPSLQHVHCHPQTKICECEKSYPVQLGPTKGCAKPKRLGEQCLYQATCVYSDPHSTCTQIKHNAACECEAGFHRSAYSKHKKQFCAADLVLISTDLPTLLGVASGIALFTGAICFVLKLFSRARYTRPRHYANAGHAPPMLYSSDTGSRRPSVASIHSSTSSAKSYSARRFERERNEKEQRLMLVELKQQQQNLQHHQQQHQPQQQQQQLQQPAPTPSPRTPHSTDELLPQITEATEIFYNEQVATTSGAISKAAAGNNGSSISRTVTTGVGTTDGPDTPLFESDAKPGSSSGFT